MVKQTATVALLLALLGVAPVACSLFLDHDDQQCSADNQCSAFTDATCDPKTHLCVTKTTSSSSSGSAGGASCTGDDGCYACKPKTTDEFLNACTDAKCQPFDKKRLTHLLPDGGLPPLP
jgi:hypothetical protein